MHGDGLYIWNAACQALREIIVQGRDRICGGVPGWPLLRAGRKAWSPSWTFAVCRAIRRWATGRKYSGEWVSLPCLHACFGQVEDMMWGNGEMSELMAHVACLT